MRVSAMYYRKPKVRMPLMLLLGWVLMFPALADSVTNDNGTYFKGPMATCLSRAKVVYPCVSLSPPAYQANSTFFSNAAPLGANLPLASDQHESGWLAKLREGEFWSPQGTVFQKYAGNGYEFQREAVRCGDEYESRPDEIQYVRRRKSPIRIAIFSRYRSQLVSSLPLAVLSNLQLHQHHDTQHGQSEAEDSL